MTTFLRLAQTFTFYIFIGLMSPAALAQQQISGRIQDAAGAALPYVNVLLLSAADSTLIKGTVTDTTGAYVMERVAEGSYRLSAQMVGYQSYFTEVFSMNGESHRFPVIQLQEATTELGEVVVASTKPMIEVTPNALVLNVEASPILQNGTAHDVLEKAPGVVIDQNGGISVKGKSNVLIYLDGKPTYMSSSDLLRMLESMPADNIEKIEIMDNPPARYDAAGNAGIINIVRSKKAATGLNGNVGFNLGYGEYLKASPSLDLNYRQDQFNVFGNYSYYYAQRFSNNNIFRNIPYLGDNDPATNTTFDQSSSMVHWVRNHNFRTGADWYITDKTTLGVLVSGQAGNWNGDRENLTVLGGVYDNPYDGLTADNRSRHSWENMTYNINFKQNLGEAGEIILDADYALRDNGSRQANDNYYFRNEGTTTEPPLLVRTRTQTDIDILAFKADYTGTIFSDWGLESGWKTSIVTTDNDLDFRTFLENDFIRDSLRSNRFQYDENINAGYMNVNKKWGERWQLQAGLRGEHTYSKGYSVTLDSTVRRNYFNLFPSASLSYKKQDQHSLSISYSRRIDRPNYGNLNPFEYFLDRFTFERGNPFLNPQYTNAYGLTYGYKNMVFLTLNYNRTTDAITQVLEQDEASQTTYQTTVNLNQIKNYSANISAPLPVTQWWTLNLNLTGFYNDIQSPFSEGEQISKSRFSYTTQAQNTFSLPKEVKVELTGFYRSPMLWGLFDIRPQYQVDMGVTKNLGKFKIQASLDDVFNIRKNKIIIQQGDIDAYINNKWETRVFRINLSYRFGNEKIQQARRRGTASEDVQQRAGGDN